MLSQLLLRHFKCFPDVSLRLTPLTLLAGANSAGKSSILQALGLLHQTMVDHEWSTRLMLNGSLLNLGMVSDVVDQITGRDSFELALVYQDTAVAWTFAGDRADMSMEVTDLDISGQAISCPTRLRYLLPADDSAPTGSLSDELRSLHYLTAERIGPREIYPLEDPQSARTIGPLGEHTASLLYRHRDKQVEPVLCLADAPGTLERQVESRMQTLFPGFALALQPVAHASAVTMGLRTSAATDFSRPANVGFGITQVLPIIVAALLTSPGGLLLIQGVGQSDKAVVRHGRARYRSRWHCWHFGGVAARSVPVATGVAARGPS